MCDCGHFFTVSKRKPFFDTARKSQRIAMRNRRALATANETMHRQEQNRANMAKKRALESPDESMYRKQQNQTNMAKKRRLESLNECIFRKENNQTNTMDKKSVMNVSVESAIASFFLSKVKMGPNFACTCCHRMMYKQNVVPC